MPGLRILFKFGSYVNFLGFKIFGLVFLFKKLLDLNSCEFWFLILILFFYLVKINKLIFLNLYANVSWVMWIFNNI